MRACEETPSRRRAALPLALALACAAAPARGADRLALVAVAEPPAGPGAELVELTHQLRAACRDRAGGVLDVPELRARLRGDGGAAALPEVERALAAAQAAFDAGEFQAAERGLRAAAEDAGRLPPSAEAHALRVKLGLRLAFAERHLGRADAAAQELERLAALEPTFAVDERAYPPSFRKEAAEVRRRVAAGPRARLTVTADAPALIFLDGKPLGPAPAAVALPPGRYRVAALVGEARLPDVEVELGAADRALALEAALASALRLEAGPGLALAAEGRTPALVRAGAWLGAARLVAVSELTDGGARLLDGALYDVGRGALLRQGRVRIEGGAVPPPQLGALATFLLTGQPSRGVSPVDLASAARQAAERSAAAAPAGLAPGPAAPAAATAAAAPRHPWARPAAWGAGAAALGLAGVTLWQGLAAHARSGEADAMLRSDGVLVPGATQQGYDDKRAAADSARRAAYLAAGGTAAFAVTAGVLGWLSWDDGGAPVVRF